MSSFKEIILVRCSWIVSVYLLMLTGVVIGGFAQEAGIGFTEILKFTTILGWLGYILIIYLLLQTTIDLLRMWKVKKHNKRMGISDGEGEF